MCIDGKTIEESPLYNPAQPYENRDPRLLKSIVCIGYPYLGMTITKENVATTGFGVKKYTSYEDDVPYYTMIIQEDGRKIKLLLDLTEEMLHTMKTQFPERVYFA